MLVNEGFLFRELPVGLYADGQVRIAGQSADTVPDEQGCVMTGIAVAQQAGLQVKHTHEQRNEHVEVVVLRERLVEGLHNVVGL